MINETGNIFQGLEIHEDKMQIDTFTREKDPNFSFKESQKTNDMIDKLSFRNSKKNNELTVNEDKMNSQNIINGIKTINVRQNIETMIMKQHNKNNSTSNKIIKEIDEEPQRLYEDNIESLKNFRKNGFINSTKIETILEEKVNSIYEMEKEKTLKLEEEKKFRNELEKRRYEY